VLAKRFSFVVIVILLHTLVKIVRSHHCLFVCCSYFFLLFLLPFVVNKDVHNYPCPLKGYCLTIGLIRVLSLAMCDDAWWLVLQRLVPVGPTVPPSTSPCSSLRLDSSSSSCPSSSLSFVDIASVFEVRHTFLDPTTNTVVGLV